jgi:high-affinity iron transporter
LSRTVIQSLSRFGEKLEAIVSVLAVIILLIVTNWVFHRFYWTGWNAKLPSLSKAAQNVTSSRWEHFALLGVGFLTVYREKLLVLTGFLVVTIMVSFIGQTVRLFQTVGWISVLQFQMCISRIGLVFGLGSTRVGKAFLFRPWLWSTSEAPG